MIIEQNEVSQWAISLDNFKPEYYPIKCVNVLQYYQLSGKTSTICKANIDHIKYLKFCVYSPAEKRYYLKEPLAFPLDVLYFKQRSTTWDSYDAVLNNIHNYISDENLYLLFTVQQIADTTALLTRLWKANLTGDGKLDYKIYVRLLEAILDLEDYKDYGRSLVGFKTVCNQMQLKIDDLWRQASEVKK